MSDTHRPHFVYPRTTVPSKAYIRATRSRTTYTTAVYSSTHLKEDVHISTVAFQYLHLWLLQKRHPALRPARLHPHSEGVGIHTAKTPASKQHRPMQPRAPSSGRLAPSRMKPPFRRERGIGASHSKIVLNYLGYKCAPFPRAWLVYCTVLRYLAPCREKSCSA